MLEFFENKKILVAGGTGLVGIPICHKLVRLGAQVTAVSFDDPQRACGILPKELRFIQSDLQDYRSCQKVVQNQDIVINLLASKGNATLGNSKVCDTYVPFLRFNTNLMDASFYAGVGGFMFVGSICEYPNIPLRHEDDVWNGLPAANDRYAGIAKRAGELQGEAYLLQHGWDAVKIIRPANIYGPYDDFSTNGQVIPAIISRVIDGENPLVMRGGKNSRRDFIHVDDVVDGILSSLEKAPPCVPINIGSGVGCTIEELVEIIIRSTPTKPEVRWEDSPPQGDNVRILDVERAKDLIKFTAKMSLERGISRTIKWYLKNSLLSRKK